MLIFKGNIIVRKLSNQSTLTYFVRHLAKKYSVMRFQSTKVDFSSITKVQFSFRE